MLITNLHLHWCKHECIYILFSLKDAMLFSIHVYLLYLHASFKLSLLEYENKNNHFWDTLLIFFPTFHHLYVCMRNNLVIPLCHMYMSVSGKMLQNNWSGLISLCLGCWHCQAQLKLPVYIWPFCIIHNILGTF